MESKKIATVLMAVYNGEKYLKEAIESILNQTFNDFDFMIINDGSTDKSKEIILSYHDERIIYIENEQNLGLIKTLNRGLKIIDTKYIIRMDADDISLDHRLETQIKYMEEHNDVAVCGSNIQLFNEFGLMSKSRVVTDSKTIRTHLLFRSPLMHPTVIMRSNIIKENGYWYDEDRKTVEDFDMWQKISHSFNVENISDILLNYRINEDGITVKAEKNIEKRDKAHIDIYKTGLDLINVKYSDEEMKALRDFIKGRFIYNESNGRILNALLLNIKRAINNERYDIGAFEKLVITYYRNNSINSSQSILKFVTNKESVIKDVAGIGFRDIIVFILCKFKK